MPIRDAATVILWRSGPGGPEILMGQRGAGAVFMPDKVVFPGGAVDDDDAVLDVPVVLEPLTARRLAVRAGTRPAAAIALAAVRELWEETGLCLGRVDPSARDRAVPAGWRGFFDLGILPDTSALHFVFRAVTPPGRPRRFDARFFLAPATALVDASIVPHGTELERLAWYDLPAARALPLPFVTRVVLAELEQSLAVGAPDPAAPVPFFHHDDEGSRFSML